MGKRRVSWSEAWSAARDRVVATSDEVGEPVLCFFRALWYWTFGVPDR